VTAEPAAGPTPETVAAERAEAQQAEREVLTWDLYGQGVRELAQAVADSGFVPDVVLGIARGGLIPAGLTPDQVVDFNLVPKAP